MIQIGVASFMTRASNRMAFRISIDSFAYALGAALPLLIAIFFSVFFAGYKVSSLITMVGAC